MPDHTPVGADTLVIDMVRRFATERLAPGAAAREKAGCIEPEIVRAFADARRITALVGAGEDVDPGDIAHAVDSYRDLYADLLDRGAA